MVITDRFNGRTVTEAFRNEDGTITLTTSCGRTMRLGVVDHYIQELPRTLVVRDGPQEIIHPTALRLLESFQGERVDYVLREDDGSITFVCPSGRHIKLTIVDGMIGDAPKVSCYIKLEPQGLFGEMFQG